MSESAIAGKVEARVTHRFAAAPERVYDAWLDPEKVRTWLRASLIEAGLPGELGSIEIDARVGGKFTFTDMREAGEARHWGTYLALDRPRRIVFTWITDQSEEQNPSKVTLTFDPDGDGCVVRLVHEMNAEWAEYVRRTERGWRRMLEATDRLLES
jgi:uncharacterized protein YndB with AHSA1/START domain